MRILHAELKIENCVAELWLNDIPFKRLGPDQAHNFSLAAHPYLLDGKNTLELIVSPGATPSLSRIQRKGEPPSGSAKARVAAFTAGQYTGDPDAPVLLETAWQANGGGAETLPRIVADSRDLGPMFGPWHWEKADRLTLNPATVDSAGAVLETLRASLAAGDPEVLLRLGDRRFQNAARAYPDRPLATLQEQFRRVVARNAAKPNWNLPPLDRELFDFRVVGGGRLLDCVNRDWRPTVRTAVLADGYPQYYPFLLCRFGRTWEIGI